MYTFSVCRVEAMALCGMLAMCDILRLRYRVTPRVTGVPGGRITAQNDQLRSHVGFLTSQQCLTGQVARPYHWAQR